MSNSEIAVVQPPGGSQVCYFDSPQRPSYPGSVLRVDIVIPAAQAAPFAIFDSLIEGYLGSHSYMGIYPPVVQVAWPGTDTRYDAGTIHIAPGDAWDRDVILHQYGHHVASSAGFLTAPCGQYTWDADLRGWGRQRTADEAARLAFREGWAEFFALAVQQPAGGAVFDDLEDKAVSHDLEKCTSRRRTPGEFYQSMVACSLWDILDAHEDLADDRDSLSKPLSDIWSVLATDKPATMADFHAAWLARRGCKVELTRILRDHGMSFLPPGCTVRVASNRPQQFVLSEQQSGSWAGTAPCVYTGMPAGSYTISWTTDCPEPPNIAQQAAAGASIGFAWSSPGDCQPPAPPAPPIVLKATATTIAFSADPSGNGDSTLFALVCCGSEPLDASFDQRWIDACGRPSPQPVWLPAAAWRDIPIAGLQSGTAYQVAASAKNAFGEAGPSFGAEARTTIAGDVNGDCRVNILDLIAIRSRLNCSICSCAGAAAADLNCDGVCNLLDLITCRNNINASCAGAR